MYNRKQVANATKHRYNPNPFLRLSGEDEPSCPSRLVGNDWIRSPFPEQTITRLTSCNNLSSTVIKLFCIHYRQITIR